MLQILLKVLVCSLTWLRATPLKVVLSNDCITPAGIYGRCVPVRECQYLVDILRTPNFTTQDQRYLDQFRCGRQAESKKILVCCPELGSVPGCGRLTLQDHIFGGKETEPDEFPWTALLVYTTKGRRSYLCGGALVSDRYVLTAAHCVDSLRIRALESVRLGEWDLTTVEDCKDDLSGNTYCNKFPHRDFEVEKIIVHEGYSRMRKNKEHDIALLKLSRAAPETDSISPICIPTTDMDTNLDVERESFDVTGWGATETGVPLSHRKLKVTLPGQNMTKCVSAFARANVTFTNNQLCVGGIRGKDSCRGDSGGPLMVIINNRWHLAGIVSLGSLKCGAKDVPGVYTRVGRYLKWAGAKMEQEERFNQLS
ncbi:CLIP domain-containing serine protease B4-like [Toxorhynchites rutilus septentrionalis]|uniref:CLIP domain-containing serine protease B4-like n=1 Tax=Toxorhynchites rutilus septentrionalis TaxID=329112 RepID=UPI00247A4D8E|nr:CLIP domain-containing serine protease B4-like [Toxorhynchites rutilus septentrionalis]XP_055634924.1 CLIP domain-containing serine protease B4-like [Toxorhynchites rutilus septentrionalis]